MAARGSSPHVRQPEGVPELPDGKFHPAMPMTCAEMQLRTRVKQKLGRHG